MKWYVVLLIVCVLERIIILFWVNLWFVNSFVSLFMEFNGFGKFFIVKDVIEVVVLW